MAKPDPRPLDRIRHHYEVERELAARLRASTKDGRTALFKTLYTELFDRVPDHPRLTRRATPEDSRKAIANQLRLISPFLSPEATLVEFAPGDCRLSRAAAERCARVIGIDISDQRSPEDSPVENFDLIVYDGYHLDLPEECADVAFSYQFLEHLHPDDVEPHFGMVHRLLKPGGVYVFDTPHRYSGPHDISRYFGPGLDCFHFQEWTRNQMRRLLREFDFGPVWVYRGGRLQRSPLVNAADSFTEAVLGTFPRAMQKRLGGRLYQSVCLAARKMKQP